MISRPQAVRWVAGIILGTTALSAAYIAASPLTLFADEAYYWDWSRHLAGAYVSKGPAVALVLRASTALLGHTELAIRLPAVLLTGLSGVFMAVLALRLCPPRGAVWAAVALAAMPLFALGRLVMTTDPALSVCWAAVLLTWSLAWSADAAGRARARFGWLVLGGLALGLGILAKPTIVLLAVALLIPVLRRRRGRAWLPGLLTAAVVAATCTTPIVWWNLHHGWPMLEHVSDQAGAHQPWSFRTHEFVVLELILVTPWLAWFILATNTAAVREVPSAIDPAEEFLAWSCLVVLGFFTLVSMETKVEPNWPAFAWFGGAVVAGRRWAAEGPWHRRWRRYQPWAITMAAVLLGLGLLLPLSHYVSGHRVLYVLDTTHRAAGFDVLGQAIGQTRDAFAAELGVAPEQIKIAGHRYQPAALAAFYTPGRPETTVLPASDRMPVAYDFWASDDWDQRSPLLLVVRGEVTEPPDTITAPLGRWRRCRVVPLWVGKQLMDRYTLFCVLPPPAGSGARR